MFESIQEFRLHAKDGYVFRVAGKRYRLDATSGKVLALLDEVDYLAKVRVPFFHVRGRIRELRGSSSDALLVHLIDYTDNPRLRLIAIWLRGHCGGTTGAKTIARFARNPDARMREAVAHALQRMGAWVELAEIAKTDPSERVRRIASERSVREFNTRFERFSRNVDPLISPARSQPLYVSPNVDFKERPFRPKPIELIRLLLNHIHALVSGGAEHAPRKT